MKKSRSAVRTTIAPLPVKLVRYRMFESDVTTRASRPRDVSSLRTFCWRALRARLGACDMNGVDPLFEGADHPNGPGPLRSVLRRADVDTRTRGTRGNRGLRVDGG